MTRIQFARLAGATALALSLALAAPALAFDSGGGGGGGGNDGGGNDGGGSGSTGGGGGGGSYSQTSAPAPSSATPTLIDIRGDIKAQNWTVAISDLKVFLRANPKSADGWNLLGYSYRNHGDLKLADTAYDRALKLNPNHIDALSYQGLLYIKLGEADEAKDNLSKIAKICGNTTCPQYTALAKALG